MIPRKPMAVRDSGALQMTAKLPIGIVGVGRMGLSMLKHLVRKSYAVFACDRHGDIQNNKILQDNALTALVSEAIK